MVGESTYYGRTLLSKAKIFLRIVGFLSSFKNARNVQHSESDTQPGDLALHQK